MNELATMWDVIVPLIITGICIGIVFSVIAGSIKIGLKLAPYIVLFNSTMIVLFSLVVWWFNI
tara:strand:+ start:1331 stop:1519 length:189 start_codon:yes stop_codon:yes gene_type:complete